MCWGKGGEGTKDTMCGSRVPLEGRCRPSMTGCEGEGEGMDRYGSSSRAQAQHQSSVEEYRDA